jgi:hypothetical protein
MFHSDAQFRRGKIAMPFRETAFDPETVKTLATALDQAWEIIERKRNITAGKENARKVLAHHVIVAANTGERDVTRLREMAIAAFEAPPVMLRRR